MRARSVRALVGVSLLVLSSGVAPVAAAQTQICPLVADRDVSSVVGSPVSVFPYMVVDSGSAIQCLFEGDAVGDGILVGRYPSFFGADDLQPFSVDQPRLHILLPDSFSADVPFSLTPVGGVGDVAAWVVPVDASTAPDSLGRLLVRQGADAFVIGTTVSPSAIATATSLARILLAAST